MLVENKFIYISLPRCASTAFMASCVKQNLDIKHYNSDYNMHNQLIYTQYDNINQINFQDFEIEFAHNHERVACLKEKFGYHHDIISVRRNKYERFISLWKHVLKLFHRYNNLDAVNKLLNLTIDELLWYKTNDLQSAESVEEVIEIFIKKYKLNLNERDRNMLRILIFPYSKWHNHDPDIIWFDFNELYKLEEWVSNKLNMDFKLMNLNSSNHFDSKLELNDEFKEKYDSIYLPYDEVKSIKTLF
jgi:tetratricopeptide (TPR) repeat protein